MKSSPEFRWAMRICSQSEGDPPGCESAGLAPHPCDFSEALGAGRPSTGSCGVPLRLAYLYLSSAISRTSLGIQKQAPLHRLRVRPHLHSTDSESVSRVLCFTNSHTRPQAQVFLPVIPNANARCLSHGFNITCMRYSFDLREPIDKTQSAVL